MSVEIRWRGHVQTVPWEDFERRVRDGEVRAETPVRFAPVTGDAFRPAGDLELFQTLADPEALQFRRNLLQPGLPIATALLVGVQIRLYLWSWLPEVEGGLQERYTSWTPAVLERGEVWRLLTYSFLHLDFTHLVFNLLFLAYTGYHLERAMGRANLATLYLGSALCGALLSMSMAPELPTLGASGGGFGLLAAAVVFGWKHWEAIPERARKYFGFAVLPYPVVSILGSIDAKNVDNWCHLGGLLGGVVLMTVLEPQVFSASARRSRGLRRGLAAVGVAVMAAIGLLGPYLVPLEPVELDGARAARPAYWRPGYSFTGDEAWFSPVEGISVQAVLEEGPRAQTGAEAMEAWIARVVDRSTVLSGPVRSSSPDAERMEMRVSRAGEPQDLIAVIVARGVRTWRVQVEVDPRLRPRLDPLIERLLGALALGEPEELAEARREVQRHPRAWLTWMALARALWRHGDADGALDALDQARRFGAAEEEVLAEHLRALAVGRRAEGAALARGALAEHPLEPEVIVAAVEALEAAGAAAEALEALEQAWAALPGDRTLRRARRARGLDR